MFIKKPASKMSLAKRKTVHGVGINDSWYMTHYKENDKLFICALYTKWVSMLNRCYSETYKKDKPSYKDCSVCVEWLTFSNFNAWMIKQDWQDKELDKDIIFTGNKVYSPETCLFVSHEVNNLLTNTKISKGELPTGVRKISNKYKSQLSGNGKQEYLGLFKTPEEASEVYKKAKSKHVLEVANEQSEPLKGYLIRISNEILNS